jgi:phage-related minor tail protein
MPDLSLVFDLLARDRASSEVGKVGESMDKAGDKAHGFGDKVGDMFGALTATAAGAGLAVGAAFLDEMDREAGTRKLSAQLGLDPAQSAAAGKLAGDLYASNYGDSIESVDEAVGAVQSSITGLGAIGSGAMKEATRDTLNFASAFGVDVTEAAQLAGGMIKNGLAPDATAAFDLMTAGFQQVPAAMREELPAILTEYGTNFRALGYSGEQAMGLLVGAAQQGPFVLDKMGDALKEFTIRGTDMSTTSVAAYKAIGLSSKDMAADILAGGDRAQGATQKVAQGLLGIKDPVTRANQAIALFGTPLEDLSVDQIPAFLQSVGMAKGGLEGVAGTADKLDGTLSSGIGPAFETLKRQAQGAANEGVSALLAGFTQGSTDAGGWQGGLQNLASTISGVFGPALSGTATFLTDTVGPALDAVFGFLSDHQTTVAVIAGIIATLLIPSIVRWGVESTVAAAKSAASWVITNASAIAGAITQTVSAGIVVAGWAGAAISTVASWALMGAQALLNGIRIAAVWVAQTALATGALLIGWAVAVASVVGGWVLMGVQSLLQAARMAAAWLIAMGPVGWIIAAVIGLVALIVANWDTVKTWTVEAWQAVVGAVSSAWEWIKGAVGAAIDWLVNLFLNFTGPGLIIKHWETIKSAFVNGVSAAVGFVADLPGKILSALAGFGTLLLGLGGDLLRGLWDGISGATQWLLNKVGAFFGDLLPGWVKDILGISSPSKVFAAFGRDSMRGFAVGIDDGAGAAIDAAERAAAAVTAAGAGLDLGGGYGSSGLGYTAPGYDMAGMGGAAGGGATHTTIVSGSSGRRRSPRSCAATRRRPNSSRGCSS